MILPSNAPQVGVWDAFGTERFNITRDVVKQRVDHRGTQKGKAYQEDELVELEFGEQSFTEEELAELDSDWGSSSALERRLDVVS